VTKALAALSAQIGEALRDRTLMLATAESCTGGWVAEVVTATSGSSAWFERGFVTYSNQAKEDMLGVSPDTLSRCGAVSEPVAREMAAGAIRMSRAQVSLAITGIAGPTGGSADKPVGTVCIAWALADGRVESGTFHFKGTRETIRRRAVVEALQRLIRIL